MLKKYAWVLFTILFLIYAGCDDDEKIDNNNNTNDDLSWSYSPSKIINAVPLVDLLFVIDNSRSMEQEQTQLRNNFDSLMSVLKNFSSGLPNVHIGVTSTDLGTLPHSLPSCSTPDGDNGKILKGENNACANPVGQNYIVDVAPQNCDIQRDQNDTSVCIDHSCVEFNCQILGEPDNLVLYEDDNGCPRCRNYEGETLEEVFSCTADLGVSGCGFEQPLEALYRAFTENNVENNGFFRENG